MTIVRQCELLEVCRSSLYYQPKPVSDADLTLMRRLDELHLKHPFLGARRLFPFTIYHLALMFRRPVAFCVGVPGAEGESLVHGSPVFEPDDGPKAENLARARAHFQGVLSHLESLLRAQPYFWLNFTPLNPVAAAGPAPASPRASAAPARSGPIPC